MLYHKKKNSLLREFIAAEIEYKEWRRVMVSKPDGWYVREYIKSKQRRAEAYMQIANYLGWKTLTLDFYLAEEYAKATGESDE